MARPDYRCGVPIGCGLKECGMPAIGRAGFDWPIHVCADHWRLMKNNGFDPRTYLDLSRAAWAFENGDTGRQRLGAIGLGAERKPQQHAGLAERACQD